MDKLASVRRRMDWLVNWLSVAMFLVIFLVVLAQIFWRYFLRSPLVWSEELSRAIFIWLSLVGWVLATRSGSHIRITFLSDRLPPALGKALQALFGVVTIAFLAALGVFGAIMAYRTLGRSLITIPQIPIGLIYLSLPATTLPGIFYNLHDLIAPGTKDARLVIE